MVGANGVDLSGASSAPPVANGGEGARVQVPTDETPKPAANGVVWGERVVRGAGVPTREYAPAGEHTPLTVGAVDASGGHGTTVGSPRRGRDNRREDGLGDGGGGGDGASIGRGARVTASMVRKGSCETDDSKGDYVDGKKTSSAATAANRLAARPRPGPMSPTSRGGAAAAAAAAAATALVVDLT